MIINKKYGGMKNDMLVKAFRSGGDFLARTRDFLEKNEAANNLILGIAGRNMEPAGDDVSRPLFLSVEEDDSVVLACLMTPPQGLVAFSDGRREGEAVELLMNYLTGNSIEIPGVIGPVGISGRFAELWSAKKGVSFELDMNQRVYELREVADVACASGFFRRADGDDIDTLAVWTAAFSAEALGEVMLHEAARELIAGKIKTGGAFIWQDKVPVTMACSARPTACGIAVNLVYTPPEHRKKGYATCCVARLSAELLAGGRKFCALFTDLKNPVSNGIYQKIGYRPVCDFNKYDFRKITGPAID